MVSPANGVQGQAKWNDSKILRTFIMNKLSSGMSPIGPRHNQVIRSSRSNVIRLQAYGSGKKMAMEQQASFAHASRRVRPMDTWHCVDV